MERQQRAAAFDAFRHAESGVLLCTDVAARGLNLRSVHWIVQVTASRDRRCPAVASCDRPWPPVTARGLP